MAFEEEGEGAQEQSIITMVEQQKRNKHRYNIFINDSFAFSVHEDILVKHRLLKGEAVENNRLQEVIEDEERNDAYIKAARFLGTRPRTQKEVRQKLKESGYEDLMIEETIKRLSDQHFIDDELFAKQWTEHRIHSQRKGKALIRQELQLKGVSRELIQGALQGIETEEELASAVDIGGKKWRQTSGETLDRKRKTASFLLRRGFSSEIVQQALRNFVDVNDDNDLWD